MSTWQEVAALCGTVMVMELVSRLCSDSEMVTFVRSLAVLTLLLSAVTSLISVDWSFSARSADLEKAGSALSGYVQQETQTAMEEQTEQYIQGLLAAAGLFPEKIRVTTDIREDSSIELTRVQAVFVYPSDVERARALLINVLGEEIKVEVTAGGN